MQETQVWSLGWEDPPGEENGNPLQYSCLENPRDRGAWRATVHGVAMSWTPLKWLSTPTDTHFHFYSICLFKISYSISVVIYIFLLLWGYRYNFKPIYQLSHYFHFLQGVLFQILNLLVCSSSVSLICSGTGVFRLILKSDQWGLLLFLSVTLFSSLLS